MAKIYFENFMSLDFSKTYNLIPDEFWIHDRYKATHNVLRSDEGRQLCKNLKSSLRFRFQNFIWIIIYICFIYIIQRTSYENWAPVKPTEILFEHKRMVLVTDAANPTKANIQHHELVPVNLNSINLAFTGPNHHVIFTHRPQFWVHVCKA